MDKNPTHAVVKAHKLTREVVARYDSPAAAGACEGADSSVIRSRCRGRMLGRDDFYFRYADDFDPEERFLNSKNCPVVVADAEAGRVLWFPTASACAKSLCFAKPTLIKALRTGEPFYGGRYRAAWARKRLPARARTVA